MIAPNVRAQLVDVFAVSVAWSATVLMLENTRQRDERRIRPAHSAIGPVLSHLCSTCSGGRFRLCSGMHVVFVITSQLPAAKVSLLAGRHGQWPAQRWWW